MSDPNKKEMSLDKRRQMIDQAWMAQTPRPSPAVADTGNWVIETYDSHVIAFMDGKYYRVSYTVDGDSVTFAPRSEWTEVEERREWVDAVKALKAGRVLSAANLARIQAAMTALQEAIASAARPEPEEDGVMPELLSVAPDGMSVLVSQGEAVKSLGAGRVGGYLVRFSTENDPDISSARDFFDKDTDFVTALPSTSPAWFHHGMNVKKQRLSHDAELSMDDLGVWAETILDERDQYEKFLLELAEKGKLGWSSGTAAHLVKRTAVGEANHVDRWPLGIDASLTHTPAEPRNSVLPLKSVADAIELPEPDAANAEAAQQAQTPEPVKASTEPLEVTTMEITEERISELVAAGVEQAMKSLPAQPAAAVTVTRDEADQPFETAGEFFKAVKSAAYYPQATDARLRPLKATGLSEGVPADGGYLVPPAYAAGIMSRVYDTNQILGRCAMDTVQGNSMVYNIVDETSHASTLYGGIIGYWLAEAGTKTASRPKFAQVELKLKKIAALAYATDELLDDVGALQSWLTRTVPEVLRWQVEEAIINGDGTGKPQGIMGSPCLVTVQRDTASHIYLADIANMWSRRWTGFNDYVWLINPDAVPQLHQLTAATAPIYLPNGNVAGSPFGTLYGRPVIETEHCQSLNTTGDIILASLSQYQTISKGGVQAATSIHVAFTTDETAYRFVYRIDGAPSWHSALTPVHSSNTVSPFVCLGSASA